MESRCSSVVFGSGACVDVLTDSVCGLLEFATVSCNDSCIASFSCSSNAVSKFKKFGF